MKTELKTKWLEALRSGSYTQGKEFLVQDSSTGEQHCCLGVLCEVLKIERSEWLSSMRKTFIHEQGFSFKSEGERTKLNKAKLPYRFALELGLETPGNRVTQNALVDMNDQGHSFSAIADYIEKYLETED